MYVDVVMMHSELLTVGVVKERFINSHSPAPQLPML